MGMLATALSKPSSLPLSPTGKTTIAPPAKTPTLFEKINATFGETVDACADSISDYSIFRALQPKILENEKKKYEDLSLKDRIKLGCSLGLKQFLPRIIIVNALALVASLFCEVKDFVFTPKLILGMITVVPILETVFFRGGVHNVIKVAQKTLNNIVPTSLKNNRVYSWINSPSCRVLIASTLYAGYHLLNASAFGLAIAIAQFAVLFFLPTPDILYETTDSLATTTSWHITNNTLSMLPICILLLRKG